MIMISFTFFDVCACACFQLDQLQQLLIGPLDRLVRVDMRSLMEMQRKFDDARDQYDQAKRKNDMSQNKYVCESTFILFLFYSPISIGGFKKVFSPIILCTYEYVTKNK